MDTFIVMLVRRLRMATLAALILWAPSCGRAGDPSFEAVYGAVLSELITTQQLDIPVLVHPLLGALDSEDPLSEPMTEYLVYDSITVPAVVRHAPDLVRLCVTARSGNCAASVREPWVVLSDIVTQGRDAFVVALIHEAAPRPATRAFGAVVRDRVVIRLEPLD